MQQSGTEGQSLNTVCCATWFWSRAQACDWQHSLSQQGDVVRGDRATFLSLFLKLWKVWDWQPWKNKSPVLFTEKKDGRTIIIQFSPTVLCPFVSGLLWLNCLEGVRRSLFLSTDSVFVPLLWLPSRVTIVVVVFSWVVATCPLETGQRPGIHFTLTTE